MARCLVNDSVVGFVFNCSAILIHYFIHTIRAAENGRIVSCILWCQLCIALLSLGLPLYNAIINNVTNDVDIDIVSMYNSGVVEITQTRGYKAMTKYKTDREKLDAVLNLLTDKTWFRLKNEKQYDNSDESFGGLMTLGHVFSKAYKIANQ